MDYNRIMQEILNIGEELLKSGAEIFRVEDSLYRMCRSYGFVRSDVYASQINIQMTVETPEGEIITQIRYIEMTSPHYDKLDQLNNLSRYVFQSRQKSLEQQFLEAVESINNAIFDNGCENKSKHGDAMEVKIKHPDLVYIDPPYYSPLSDNEYLRRYHFVEGLARDWKGVEIQENFLNNLSNASAAPFLVENGVGYDLNFFVTVFSCISRLIL